MLSTQAAQLNLITTAILSKHLAGRHDQKLHGVRGREPIIDYSQLVEKATPSNKRRFATLVKEKYAKDKRFKILADTLSKYTQGAFDPFIGAATAINSNNVDEWLMYESERRDKNIEDYKSGKGFLHSYGGLFTTKNVLGEDIYGQITVRDALDGATVLMDAVAQSPITAKPIFRGDQVPRHLLDEIVTGKTGKHYKKQIVEAEKQIAEYELEFRSAKSQKDKKEIQKSINREKSSIRITKNKIKEQRRLQKTLTVGETFDVGLLSFSHDESVGRGFATRTIKGTAGKGLDYKFESPILYKVVGNHNGLSVSVFSPYRQSEVLIGGKFRVKSVTHDFGMRVVELEQVSRYDISKP